jgi:murein DD-endopeptidase MepM/ murein hydrolase activator NlpD
VLVTVVGATVVGAAVLVPRTADGRGVAARSAVVAPMADAGAVRPGPLPSDDRARATPPYGARWRWPIRPRPPVLRPFRAPPSPYAAGHRGLDLAAADGVPVLAVEGGTVTHAGVVAGRGTVSVAHSGGLTSTYEPVDPVVAAGAVVSAGDVLGTVRARDGPALHCGSRVCLHLGARREASYVDPHPLLAGGRIALLPLR